MAGKVNLAGENGCKRDVGVAIRDETRGLTRPIPSLSVVNKVNKMDPRRSSKFSLPLLNQVKARACVQSRSETAFGLSQASSWTAKGRVFDIFMSPLRTRLRRH